LPELERRRGVERVTSDSSSVISARRRKRRDEERDLLAWMRLCLRDRVLVVVADQSLEADLRASEVDQLLEPDLAAKVGAVALREEEIEMEADLAVDDHTLFLGTPLAARMARKQLAEGSLIFRPKRTTMAGNNWYKTYERLYI
jgi:hypothetical protein